MKTAPLIVGGILACVPLITWGQAVEGNVTQPAAEAETKKPTTELTAPATPKPKTPSETVRKTVFFTGFFSDLARTNNRAALLSLRQANDPARDLANVVRDPVTRQTVGFRLFSVDF